MVDPVEPPAGYVRNRSLRRAAIVLAVLLGAVDLIATGVLFVNASNEAAQRRTENCKLFVGRWRADVQAVAQTTAYLRSLGPEELSTPLNKRVAENLPASIDRAEVERPPTYCDVDKGEKRRAVVVLGVGRDLAKRNLH